MLTSEEKNSSSGELNGQSVSSKQLTDRSTDQHMSEKLTELGVPLMNRSVKGHTNLLMRGLHADTLLATRQRVH